MEKANNSGHPLYSGFYDEYTGSKGQDFAIKPEITDEDIQEIVDNVLSQIQIDIPSDKFLRDVKFNQENSELTFNVGSEDGDEVVPIKVSLGGLIKLYTAGDNVTISPNGEISVNLASYVTKSELDGKGYLIAEDIKDFITTKAVEEIITTLAVKNEVAKEIAETKKYADTQITEAVKSLATKNEVEEAIAQATENMATEEYVEEAINNIDIPDLSPYVTAVSAEMMHQQMTSSLNAKITALQNQVEAIMTNSVEVVETESVPATYNNPTKSVVANDKPLNGTVVEVPETFTKPVAANTKIVAKDVTLNGIQSTEGDYNQVLTIKADSVTITDSEMNIDGNVVNYNAATGKASYINSPLTINDASNIFINGLNFNAQNGYNGIEIGLSDTEPKVKNITIENFDIDGRMTQNLFSIYAFADNAVINISNCHFTDTYGIMRISNKFNNKGLVINITNCTVDKTTCTTGAPNMFLCQDYTSATSEQFFTDNQFGNGKVTLNITNLIYDGQKVTKDMYVGVPMSERLNILAVYCAKVNSESGHYIDSEKYPEYYPVVNVF